MTSGQNVQWPGYNSYACPPIGRRLQKEPTTFQVCYDGDTILPQDNDNEVENGS